jgi:hypothetical protein
MDVIVRAGTEATSLALMVAEVQTTVPSPTLFAP